MPSHFVRILAFDPGRYSLTASSVRVAIFIKEAQARLDVDRAALIDLFAVTPREADVVALLLAGHAPKEIAESLGLSLPTVRTHLARVFDKTGTRTQANLVSLVSRLKL
jgi:DNA-binding CsgD family transcriptional regulator